MSRRTLPRGLVPAALEPAVAAVVTVLAALSFAGFYGTRGWLPALAGAVLLGTAVGALAAARRWAGWLTAVVAAAVLAAYALAVCYPDRTWYGLPGPDALGALGTGVTSGWARMLSVAVPADVGGDLLVTPVLMAYAAGLAGALLALHTRLVTVLALPPVLLLVAGLGVSAPRPSPWLPLGGGLLLGLLVLVLLRANRVAAADREGIAAADADAVGVDLAARRWHSTLGRIAFGLPVAAVVAVAAGAGAAALPLADGSDRADPRTLRQQDFRLTTGLTPLVQVKPQLEDPAAELFRVRVSQRGGSYPVDRVRVAALDSFDGALWTQSRDFLTTGSVLPPPPDGRRLSGPVITVELDVEVTRLPQPLLPVFGRPVQVVGADLAFDPANGTLVSTRPSVSGYSYRLESEVRSQAGIAGAAAPTDLAEYTRLPDPPGWLTERADQVTREWRTPWTQLTAIQDDLREQGYTLAARPGHSYGAVYRSLLGQDDERGGYAEQYASAFAMLARAKGYAARVAVGYRLQPQKRDGDRYRVDSTDAHAWPEAYLEGYGWVPFEPTNTGNPSSPKPPRDPDTPILPNDPGVQQPREPEAADAPAVEAASGGAAAVGRAAVLAAVLVVLVPLLLVGLVVLAKQLRRRRRRRRGSPAERVAAAWRETVDRLRERGVRVGPSTTPAEVAQRAATGPAKAVAGPVTELASIATTAVCAPEEPVEDAARRSWELESRVRRALDAATPLPVRLRALVDPRPLLPRRRPRPAGGRSGTGRGPAGRPDPSGSGTGRRKVGRSARGDERSRRIPVGSGEHR